MNEFNAKNMNHIFLKWKDGKLTSSEQKQLQEWLNSAPQRKKEWQLLKQIWQAASAPEIPEGNPAELQWKKLAERIEITTKQPLLNDQPSVLEKLKSLMRPSPGWAFAGLAVLSFFILIKFGPTLFMDNWQTVQVPYGQTLELTLPDGSEVELSPGSILEYPESFANDLRQLELTGEAFFQVNAGDAPFEVETDRAKTRVLGTAFNISTWDNRTEVFVLSGKVALRKKNAPETQSITIDAGQLGVIEVEPKLSIVEDAEAILAWREGRLVFHRSPLQDVLEEIARFHNISIQADSNLLRHTVSATFSNEPTLQIVESLAASLQAKVEKTPGGYRLYSK